MESRLLLSALTAADVQPYYDQTFYFQHNPDVAAAVAAGKYSSGFQQYMDYGMKENRQASALFDPNYYSAKYPNVLTEISANGYSSKLEHFIRMGIGKGYVPTIWFDSAYYDRTQTDVAAAVRSGALQSDFDHFIHFGLREGRNAISLFDGGYYMAANPSAAAAVNAGTFRSAYEQFLDVGMAQKLPTTPYYEEAYYLSHNPDVAGAVSSGAIVSGFYHFYTSGLKEGRDPSPLFSSSYYLAQNPSITSLVAAKTYSSAFDHFINVGLDAGISPTPWYNESYYLARNGDVAAAVRSGALRSGLQHFFYWGRNEPRKAILLFDPNYYLQTYADARAAVAAGTYSSAFNYFLAVGRAAGHVPSLFFDEAYYLSAYPDIVTAVSNKTIASGYEHYVMAGAAEGRKPMLYFDDAYYLTSYRDVAGAIAGGVFRSAYEHFVDFGYAERRAPMAIFRNTTMLASNPDIAAAVASGAYVSGFDYFYRYGRFQPGSMTAVDISNLDRPDPAFPILPASVATPEALAARFTRVQNVRSYGAIGNGVADDTNGILMAIAAAGSGSCVYFPPGRYVVTRPVLISNKPGITLIGPEATIQYSASTWTSSLIAMFRVQNSPNLRFDYLNFDGVNRNWGSLVPNHDFIISFEASASGASTNASVTNSTFVNMSRDQVAGKPTRYAAAIGQSLGGGDGILIENNYFARMGGGMVITQGANTTIRNNTMLNAGDTPIALNGVGCTGGVVQGNYIGNVGYGAIGIERGASQFTVTGNYVRNAQYLVWTDPQISADVYGGTISYNTVYSTASSIAPPEVIFIQQGYHDIAISHNTFAGTYTGVGSMDIVVRGSGHIIEYNTFLLPPGAQPIRLEGASDVTIANNLFQSTTAAGTGWAIYLNAGSVNTGITIRDNRFEGGSSIYGVSWGDGASMTGALANNTSYGMAGLYQGAPFGTLPFDVNFYNTIVLS